MRDMARTLAMLLVTLVAVAGCRTMTGRSAGQWIDDKTTTAKVKAALAGTEAATVTRIDVDTFGGTVYLTGAAPNEEMKRRVEQVARDAAQPQPVVSHLSLMPTRPASVAAFPRTSAAQQVAATPADTTSARLAGLPRFARLEAEAGGPVRDTFAAYDSSGQRVATVYSLPVDDLRRRGVAGLRAGQRTIDHVSIYPQPGSDGRQYHVVLWHVSPDEAARLQ